MNMTSRRLHSVFLILTSVWWSWTFLVDFFIVKAAFKIIDNFWEAGELGMTVFSKLNSLKVVVSTLLIALFSIVLKRKKAALPFLIMSVILWILAMTYFVYLTPKIMDLTDLWRKADLIGITAVHGIPDIQQEHQYFHNLYVGLDSVKLILLSIMLGLGVWKQEKYFE